MYRKLLILLLVIFAGCSNQPRMITSKQMVQETYWIHRYKQKALQIDRRAYDAINALNISSTYTKPGTYYFCLDGKEIIEVDKYTYEHQKEGEYFIE